MTDKARPGIKITLDRERVLNFDLNAMIAFEEATGKSFLRGEIDLEQLGLKDLRLLLWACLLSDDPSLTLMQLGALLDAASLRRLWSELSKAVNLGMPDEEAEDSSRPLAANPPPG